MKRILISIIAICLPVLALAQAQIFTKKMKISDFTEKTTKIVLTGNPFYDSIMEDEVTSRWRISPFEFCTLEEFEELKTSNDYYFLITTHGQFRREKEAGLKFLSLLKGGCDKGEDINDLLEIISIPISSVENPSGRELILFPAFLDIIQDYTLVSMEKDFKAYTGLSSNTQKFSSTDSVKVVFNMNDISTSVSEQTKMEMEKAGIAIVNEDEANLIFENNTPKTLISYIVVPTDAKHGSFCYKMLIDCEKHKLYYFRRHKISKSYKSGFQGFDIEKIIKSSNK